MKKYYVDTAIWIDLYENRRGFNGEPLGDYAMRLFSQVMARNDRIVISDFIIRELEMNYSVDVINGMMKPFEKFLERISVDGSQIGNAATIAAERRVPKGDVLHALIARDNQLIMITRDKHFNELLDITSYYRPEDVT